MYRALTDVLFWCYWAIAAGAGALVLRELLRSASWKLQVTAAIALIPLIVRVFLLK